MGLTYDGEFSLFGTESQFLQNTFVLLILSILTVVLLFVSFVRQRNRRMTLLQRNGIPGPIPHWIFGNLREYLITPNVIWDSQLLDRYGPICGYYLGAKPVILVSDVELINLIQVKDGDNFLHRPRRVPGGINPDPQRAKMLGNLQVADWQNLRKILDKVFSPKRLQAMAKDVEKRIQIFMSHITPEKPEIDFYPLLQNLTLDLIGKSGFGIDSNIQENPNEALKSAVEHEFSKSTGTFLLKCYLCFPEMHAVLQPLRVRWEKVKAWCGYGEMSELWKLGTETVRQRKVMQSANTDLLQVMLDSKKLDDDSIVANSVLFFEAAFETMSAGLAFTIHLLMKNREIQDSLRKEIREVLMDTVFNSIEKLKDLKLLDAVINESLRLYPPQTTFIGRSGKKDLEYCIKWNGSHNECTVPKNVHIQVCLHQILNSEMIWEEPRRFNPHRFLEDNLSVYQKLAFQPFGRGKRICIGRKYADLVLKTFLVELLSKYRLIPSDTVDGDDEIEVLYKTATMTPKTGVFGKVVLDPLL